MSDTMPLIRKGHLMKKTLIALAVCCSLIIVAVIGIAAAELHAKTELESQVTAYLDECGIEASTIEVHGRPYLIYAAQDRADLTYVDTAPAAGANKDQLLIHRLVDGRADRLTRFITFDYPAAATPIKNADGSFSDSATIGAAPVTFSAEAGRTSVRMFADGQEAGRGDLLQPAMVRDVSATDDGVVVEVEYASSSCR